MNLTSKRMLRFLSVCAGAFALTAAAQTNYVSDSFEYDANVLNSSVGDGIGMYKAEIVGTMQDKTNFAWKAEADDASTIQLVGDNPYGGLTRPITNAATYTQALKLETEGKTLTRYIAFTNVLDGMGQPTDQTVPTTVSFSDKPVYVDTLIKFTPSEDDPEIDTLTDPRIKLAVFVNVSSNLVVRHKYYDKGTGGYPETNSVFGAIDPESWYRLTIMLAYNNTPQTMFGRPVFEIYLDGAKLTHENGAVSDDGTTGVYTGGSWFYALTASLYGGGDSNLGEVSFQGTGYVDDLVVGDTAVGISDTSLMLTLSFADVSAYVSVKKKADGQSLASGDQIPDETELIIDAVDWYQVTSVSGTDITFTGTPAPGALVNCTTGTISTASAGKTATIVVEPYAADNNMPAGHPYHAYDANKVATWALAKGVSEADISGGAYLENYLLNVGKNVDTEIEIDSIDYDSADGGTATITVKATANTESKVVDFDNLNGELMVRMSDDLTTLDDGVGATTKKYEFTVGPDFMAEIQVTNACQFIRAVVE